MWGGMGRGGRLISLWRGNDVDDGDDGDLRMRCYASWGTLGTDDGGGGVCVPWTACSRAVCGVAHATNGIDKFDEKRNWVLERVGKCRYRLGRRSLSFLL